MKKYDIVKKKTIDLYRKKCDNKQEIIKSCLYYYFRKKEVN